MLVAGTMMCTNASAVNYSPGAKALGFNLDTGSYKNIGWVKEQSSKAYVIDDSGIKRHCGTLTTQTLYATSIEKYLLSNQMDVWLTRTYTQPKKTTYDVNGFLWFKTQKNISFVTTKVVEDETMPSGIKLAHYMATSPSQMITKSLRSGWSINANVALSYKDIEIGNASAGWAEESSSDVSLCTIKNESRTNRFKVTYNILDPYYNLLSDQQRSYCYGLNYFYTSKSVYGSSSAMKKYLAPSNTTAYFVGHYTGSAGTTIYDVPVTGTANVSFSAMIGAW